MSRTAIFVFGSNLAGRHGKGSALCAFRNHDAQYGNGKGLQGKSYAIPTKDATLRTLPLSVIREHVKDFVDFAKSAPELEFVVVAIGCGLAGYSPEEIAPLFTDAPENCLLPPQFKRILHPRKGN